MKKQFFALIAALMLSFAGLSQTIAIEAFVDQEVSCYGNADGAIVAAATPDTLRWDYFAQRGADLIHNSHGTFLGLKPGKYKVWAASVLGMTKPAYLTVTQPNKLRPVFAVDKAPTQDAPKGSLTIEVMGGTAELQPFLISWWYSSTKAGVKQLLNPEENFKNNIDPAYAGYYFIEIEDDRGCFSKTNYLFRRQAVKK